MNTFIFKSKQVLQDKNTLDYISFLSHQVYRPNEKLKFKSYASKSEDDKKGSTVILKLYLFTITKYNI